MASKKFNFADSFTKLTDIVEKLEYGEMDLDKALQEYEDGLKIVQECKKHLESVENKVKVIKEKYNDNVESED